MSSNLPPPGLPSGPPTVADGRFYVQRLGLVEGPYAPFEIHQMVSSGYLALASYAYPAAGGSWFPLSQLVGPALPAHAQPMAAYSPSAKSKGTAAVLAFFLGWLGVHDFYLGRVAFGVIKLLCSTLGWFLLFPPFVAGLWAFVDFILILAGSITDSNGQPLT